MRSLRGFPAFRAFLLGSVMCVAALPTIAKDTWVEVRSPNFTVLSNSGEKEARKVADQFEQFRELFHVCLPHLRIDLGKPIVIFAVKNEDSLKLLLPEYWEVKGRVHPAGLYAPGEESHLVALKTGYEGPNPYEIVYHEYTHALMNVNFRALPIWLGEGLAELFANSRILDKDVELGKPAGYHLRELQESRLIPIDALLTADVDSPYYNEQNRASVFYAESWAIVHYLMMDPEAQKAQLLTKFFNAWDTTGDQLQAARDTFGDLKKFGQTMELYSRQSTFYYRKVPTSIHGDPKSYSSRELPPAELAAYRAFFYIHTHRPNEAKAAIDEALQAAPDLPLAYEARGLLAYSVQDYSAAETAFSRAIELHSSSYFAYFFDAEARFRRGPSDSAETTMIAKELEKALAINPLFAPAYSVLGSVYSTQPENQPKAVDAGVKAVRLEPGNLRYAVNLGFILVNSGKTNEAKALSARIRQAAKEPQDKANLETLDSAIERRANYDIYVAQAAQRAREAKTQEQVKIDTDDATLTEKTAAIPPAKTPGYEPGSVAAKHANEEEFAVEGVIASVECNAESTGRLTLAANQTTLRFIYPALSALRLADSDKDITNERPACSTWKGRRVRLYFYKLKNKPYAGELDTIQFF